MFLLRSVDGDLLPTGSLAAKISVWQDLVGMMQADADMQHPLLGSAKYGDMFTKINTVFKVMKRTHPEWIRPIVQLLLPMHKPLAVCSLAPDGICPANGDPAIATIDQSQLRAMLEDVEESASMKLLQDPNLDVDLNKEIAQSQQKFAATVAKKVAARAKAAAKAKSGGALKSAVAKAKSAVVNARGQIRARERRAGNENEAAPLMDGVAPEVLLDDGDDTPKTRCAFDILSNFTTYLRKISTDHPKVIDAYRLILLKGALTDKVGIRVNGREVQDKKITHVKRIMKGEFYRVSRCLRARPSDTDFVDGIIPDNLDDPDDPDDLLLLLVQLLLLVVLLHLSYLYILEDPGDHPVPQHLLNLVVLLNPDDPEFPDNHEHPELLELPDYPDDQLIL